MPNVGLRTEQSDQKVTMTYTCSTNLALKTTVCEAGLFAAAALLYSAQFQATSSPELRRVTNQ